MSSPCSRPTGVAGEILTNTKTAVAFNLILRVRTM